METGNARERELLWSRYRGLPEQARVAFIDESYRTAEECIPGEQPFYLLTAVLLNADVLDGTRQALVNIAGGRWWHTTDFAATAKGRGKITEMVDYLARYQDPCVIAALRVNPASLSGKDQALSSPIHMRHDCVRELITAIASPDKCVLTGPPAQLLVFEKQRRQEDTDRDNHTLRELRKAGTLPRSLPAQFVSPSVEQLLWLPDVVAHLYRRQATHNSRLIERLTNQIITVKKSDPLGAAAVIQGVSPLFP